MTVYISTLFAAYGDDGQGPVRSVSPLTPETAESALSSRAHLPNRVSHTFWDLISNHLLDFDTPSGNSVKLRIQFELLVSVGLNHVNSLACIRFCHDSLIILVIEISVTVMFWLHNYIKVA